MARQCRQANQVLIQLYIMAPLENGRWVADNWLKNEKFYKIFRMNEDDEINEKTLPANPSDYAKPWRYWLWSPRLSVASSR